MFIGNIEQFRKSNYFDKRLKMAKKFHHQTKKQNKKGEKNKEKKTGKGSKKKADELETREKSELKKVKKVATSTSKDNPPVSTT